jgi:hypothetical protein
MDRFVEGAERLHGISNADSQRIWKRIVTSGTYSFVYAHAVSYSILGLWCAWLKAHYPLEFYAASLAKAGDAEAQYKLLQDALAHGISVKPPRLNVSKRSWSAVEGTGLVAGLTQIPGIAAKTADKILAEGPYDSWEDIQRVPGIGPAKTAVMASYSSQQDPFGLNVTRERMDAVGEYLRGQRRIPRPTHTGAEVAEIYVEQNYGATAKKNYGKGPRVVYCGIVKERNMQDAVENRRSRTGEEAEDILAALHRPDLLAYCSLRCYDTTDEEVYLRVNRFRFPELKRIIESITVGHDVVVCVGNRIAGFGTPVMVRDIFVIDPD